MDAKKEQLIMAVLDLMVRAVRVTGGRKPTLEEVKGWLSEIKVLVSSHDRVPSPPPPRPDDTELENG
jgi:hypothetical protein